MSTCALIMLALDGIGTGTLPYERSAVSNPVPARTGLQRTLRQDRVQHDEANAAARAGTSLKARRPRAA